MRVLLDECLPARLRRDLPSHEVTTVPQAGWAGIKNGKLLRLIAESGQFDVFLTMDKRIISLSPCKRQKSRWVWLRFYKRELPGKSVVIKHSLTVAAHAEALLLGCDAHRAPLQSTMRRLVAALCDRR